MCHGFFGALFLIHFEALSSTSTAASQSPIPAVKTEYEQQLSAAIDEVNSLKNKYRERLEEVDLLQPSESTEIFSRTTKVVAPSPTPGILKGEHQKDGFQEIHVKATHPTLSNVIRVGDVDPTSLSTDSGGKTTNKSPSSSVASTDDNWLRNRTSLIELLEKHSIALRNRYPAGTDFTSAQVRYLGTHKRAERKQTQVIPTTPLTNALTESYFGLRSEQFIIGVTGGSSSPGEYSYVALLQEWFASKLNFTIGIRNGAMGASSQLQTSPCIYQIIGDRTKFESDANVTQKIDLDTYLQASPIDLLLWEFTQNDGRMVFHQVIGNDIRKSSAELYLRGLFSHGSRMPLAVGFVHLWDVTIHKWEYGSDLSVPDLAWTPVNEVRSYYDPYFDCFAINTIRFILGPTCINQTTNTHYSQPPPNCVAACANCTSKKSFLSDLHHPNGKGYIFTRDILVYTILAQWLEALNYEVKLYRAAKATQPSLRSLPHEAIQMNQANPDQALSMPLLVPNTILPITRGMRSACRIGGQPLFAPPDPHLRFECDPSATEVRIPTEYAPVEFTGSDHVNPGFLPVCAAVPRVDGSIFNKIRGDRKMPYAIPNHDCPTAHFGWDRQPPVFNETTLDESGKVIHHPPPPFLPPLVIHLRGMNRLRYALFECHSPNFDCNGVRIIWAGRELKMNVNTTGTLFDTGRFGLIHKFTDEEIEHAKGKPTYFSLSYCPTPQAPRALLHRHSVWYED